MPINYYCQIYHRVRLKQIRFKFKVVKHFINQMNYFAILLNHLDEMAMKPFVKWIRNRRTEASLPAIFCLIHFETRNPTIFFATALLVVQTLLPEFGAEKFWEWNSPKGAWSITSFSFLQHIFYNSSFKKIFPCWNFPRKWFSFDWQQSGAETEMSLSCTSFPSNQCHWVHSELPGATEILKTESFALIFPLCQCHQICQPVQDTLEWKNCFPSTDRKDLLPLKGGQRVAICSNTLLLF